MFGDGWLDDFALMPPYACVGTFLVHSHQAAVAGDVTRDNCSQTTRCLRGRRLVSSAPEGIDLTAGGLLAVHNDTANSDCCYE